jgi:hypothetical protein
MLINLILKTSEHRRRLDICRKWETTESINLLGIRNESKIHVGWQNKCKGNILVYGLIRHSKKEVNICIVTIFSDTKFENLGHWLTNLFLYIGVRLDPLALQYQPRLLFKLVRTMGWREVEISSHDIFFKTVALNHGIWGKPLKVLCRDSRLPDREPNPGPPEYEIGMLSTRLQRFVMSAMKEVFAVPSTTV